MASSSSRAPPSWIVLGRIAIFDDGALGQSPVGVALDRSAVPGVSRVRISTRLLPEAVTHRGVDNPSILSVDPSGGLLLIRVILRPASVSQPVVVALPDRPRYVLTTGFVTSYLVVDTTDNKVYSLPHPGVLKGSTTVGIFYFSSGSAARYVVADLLQFDSGDRYLRYFDSSMSKWARKLVRPPIPPGVPFTPGSVLSHNGRLWWVDLSCGLFAWDPVNQVTPFSFFELPPRKAFRCSREEAADLDKHRCVSDSGGQLRFVDMDSRNKGDDGMRKVSFWTLQHSTCTSLQHSTCTSGKWSLDYEASFHEIWSHKSYKTKRLPQRLPVLAFIHPTKPGTIYFFLDNHIFSVDLQGSIPITVECDDYLLPSSGISSRFFHAWELEQRGEGSTSGVNVDFLEWKFTASYHAGWWHQQGPVEGINAYSGVHGQTRACASQAIDYWNRTHSTSYELDLMEPMDSNIFNVSGNLKFDIEQSYFHANFYGKSSGGKKQLFFAELRGEGGPTDTITVIPLGQHEDAVRDSSAEHICQCCTGLMHPYSTNFVGGVRPPQQIQHQLERA